MIASVNPISVPKFESFIPALSRQFRRACRFMRLEQDREEAMQEMMAIAYYLYIRLIDREKFESVHSTPLGNFSIRSFFDGRQFTGISSTDVFAPRCQKLGRSDIRRLEYRCKDGQIREISVFDKYPQPSSIACFNIDFDAWTDSLDAKKREILFAILEGNPTSILAKHFQVSPGRISQIRQELVEAVL